MERKDIITLASEAGFGKLLTGDGLPTMWHGADLEMLERFANLVAAKERCVMRILTMEKDMSHTKEPLTYMELPAADGEFMVLGGEGQGYGLVASCTLLEDARRIVACVNACAGISTENLEDNVPVKELTRRYNATIRERDELLTALETVERYVHDDFVAAGIGQLIAKIKTHNDGVVRPAGSERTEG